jgi:hypothetical protein
VRGAGGGVRGAGGGVKKKNHSALSQEIIIQNEKKIRFFLSRIYGMD